MPDEDANFYLASIADYLGNISTEIRSLPLGDAMIILGNLDSYVMLPISQIKRINHQAGFNPEVTISDDPPITFEISHLEFRMLRQLLSEMDLLHDLRTNARGELISPEGSDNIG